MTKLYKQKKTLNFIKNLKKRKTIKQTGGARQNVKPIKNTDIKTMEDLDTKILELDEKYKLDKNKLEDFLKKNKIILTHELNNTTENENEKYLNENPILNINTGFLNNALGLSNSKVEKKQGKINNQVNINIEKEHINQNNLNQRYKRLKNKSKRPNFIPNTTIQNKNEKYLNENPIDTTDTSFLNNALLNKIQIKDKKIVKIKDDIKHIEDEIKELDIKLDNDKTNSMIVLFRNKWKDYVSFRTQYDMIFKNNIFFINKKEIDLNFITILTMFFNDNNTFTYKFLNVLIHIANKCLNVNSGNVCSIYLNLCNEYKAFIYKYAYLHENMQNELTITTGVEYKFKLKYNTFMDNYRILLKIMNKESLVKYYDKQKDKIDTLFNTDINESLRLIITKTMNKEFLENLLNIILMKVNDSKQFSIEKINRIIHEEDEELKQFQEELKKKSKKEIIDLMKQDILNLEKSKIEKENDLNTIKKIKTILKYIDSMNTGGRDTPEQNKPIKAIQYIAVRA